MTVGLAIQTQCWVPSHLQGKRWPRRVPSPCTTAAEMERVLKHAQRSGNSTRSQQQHSLCPHIPTNQPVTGRRPARGHLKESGLSVPARTASLQIRRLS